MSDFKLPPYILQELPDITESVNFPIINIQRIKVTIRCDLFGTCSIVFF